MKHKLLSMFCALLVLTLLLTPAALAAEVELVRWELPEQGVTVDLPADLWVDTRDKLITANGADAAFDAILFNAYGVTETMTTNITATATPVAEDPMAALGGEMDAETELILSMLGIEAPTVPSSFKALSDQELQKLADSYNGLMNLVVEFFALEAGDEPEMEMVLELMKGDLFVPYTCANGKYLMFDMSAESSTTVGGMSKTTVVQALGYMTVENGMTYMYIFGASCPKNQVSSHEKQVKAIVDSITYSEPVAPIVFPDTEKHWARHDIGRAVRMGLFGADEKGRFNPEESATRAMLVTALYRLAGSPAVGDCPYPDVKAGAWYADAATWAAENGIVKGINGKFKPDDSLTREQMAVFFQRFTAWKGHDISLWTEDFWGVNDYYNDEETISDWAKDAVAWAVENGLLTGDVGNVILPQGLTTRAELSAVLMRFVDAEADGMFVALEDVEY